MCFPKNWAHCQSGIQLYARFWSVVLDCDSEPKIKMLFLCSTSSKKDGFPAGVNDEVSANLQTPQWNFMKFLKLRVKFFKSSKRHKLSDFFWNKGSNFSPMGKNKVLYYLIFNKEVFQIYFSFMKKIASPFFAMFTFINTTCWLPSSAAVLPTLRGQKRARSTSHTSGCLSFQLEQRNNFLMAFGVNCKQFGFGVADLQQIFVVGGCREKGLCPNAIPLWPARRKK